MGIPRVGNRKPIKETKSRSREYILALVFVTVTLKARYHSISAEQINELWKDTEAMAAENTNRDNMVNSEH